MTRLALTTYELQEKLDHYRRDPLACPATFIPIAEQPLCTIEKITHDSRRVSSACLYIALAGRNTHGARFIPQAIEKGAVAIALPTDTPQVFIDQLSQSQSSMPIIWLSPEHQRVEMAYLSEWIYGSPMSDPPESRQGSALSLIGITGTNGKTTTSTLLADILMLADGDVGLIGTIETRGGGIHRSSNMTTMESPDLHAHYRALLDAGVERCVMEVSSIGIEESRVAASKYDRAAFLNLSEDHLDYHGEMQCYADAKLRLFTELLDSEALCIICIDGQNQSSDLAHKVIAHCTQQGYHFWRCSTQTNHTDHLEKIEVYWRTLHLSTQGINGILVTPLGELELSSPLMGLFNASNIAVAASLALSLGIDHTYIQAALQTATVKGRMERIELPNEPVMSDEVTLNTLPSVRVDYAHTPDAIKRATEALKHHCNGHLWILFGCGGDRDIQKRPLMGAATESASGVILTSDNPRDENPMAIIEQVCPGLVQSGKYNDPSGPTLGAYWIEVNRAIAIYKIILNAEAEDLILIAGKGHEPYQEGPNGLKVSFSDQDYVREGLHLRRRLQMHPIDSLHSVRLCADTGGRVIFGQHKPLSGAAIDTRKINSTESLAFFCLQGQRDGHDFIASAIDQGAQAVVVKLGWSPNQGLRKYITQSTVTVIEVSDPEKALALWAVGHRQRVFKGVMIGLTGSNGKTSTKEILASGLRQLGSTLATQGNYNNHLGVPLTLLQLRAEHEYAVIEMGMNAPGEIAQLTSWVQPDLGLITTISSAHLAGLGSLEAVAAAKGELITQCGSAPILMPSSIPIALRQVASQEAIKGKSQPLIYLLPNVTHHLDRLTHEQYFTPNLELFNKTFTLDGSQSHLRLNDELLDFSVKLLGEHQIENARLALAAGLIASDQQTQQRVRQYSEKNIKRSVFNALIKGIGECVPAPLRGELLRYPRPIGSHQEPDTDRQSIGDLQPGTMWADCYNANPQSMLASVSTFFNTPQEEISVLVLGMIGELGERSKVIHFELGQALYELTTVKTYVFTVGDHAQEISRGLISSGFPKERSEHFAIDQLSKLNATLAEINPNSILIKGSRSVKLERLLEPLQASRS